VFADKLRSVLCEDVALEEGGVFGDECW
jgi:hypothetical protein